MWGQDPPRQSSLKKMERLHGGGAGRPWLQVLREQAQRLSGRRLNIILWSFATLADILTNLEECFGISLMRQSLSRWHFPKSSGSHDARKYSCQGSGSCCSANIRPVIKLWWRSACRLPLFRSTRARSAIVDDLTRVSVDALAEHEDILTA